MSKVEVKEEKEIFPTLKHIDEIKEAVKNSKEFVFNKVGNFIFSSYKITSGNTFPDPDTFTKEEEIRNAKIRREIRGLVFDSETGKLVSRTLHKFFNINEREETHESKIKFDQENVFILEKLDGSMVTPLLDNNLIRFRTKLSYNNDFTSLIEKFVYKDVPIEKFDISTSDLLKFSLEWINKGFTPIFEWCSPEARIVLDYKEPSLNVIAIRKVDTGEYVPYPEIKKSAESFNLPCVKAWEIKAETTTQLVKEIKKLEQLEGCVLRFNDGRMYKIKSEWYIDLHRCKSFLTINGLNESHVWGLVFDSKVDDTLSTLNSEEDKKKLQNFNDSIWDYVEKKTNKIQLQVEEGKKKCSTKKEYVEYCKDVDPVEKRVLFLVFEGKDPQKVIIDVCRGFITKNSTLDSAKKLLECQDLIWTPFEEK
jgi:RNA ligase